MLVIPDKWYSAALNFCVVTAGVDGAAVILSVAVGGNFFFFCLQFLSVVLLRAVPFRCFRASSIVSRGGW